MPDYIPQPFGTILACVLVIAYLIIAKVQDSREQRATQAERDAS